MLTKMSNKFIQKEKINYILARKFILTTPSTKQQTTKQTAIEKNRHGYTYLQRALD